MQIKCTNRGTRRVFDPAFMDAPVEFDRRGKATVTEKVGAAMVKRWPAIEAVDTKPERKHEVEGGE